MVIKLPYNPPISKEGFKLKKKVVTNVIYWFLITTYNVK